MKEQIDLGRWTQKSLGLLLKEASEISGPGKRIAFLSKHFLGTVYKESTLIGGPESPEVFVIDLETVDCFTFIDYIEAMRLSGSFVEFRKNLEKVRYRSGTIAYENRNHFFTDWREFNNRSVEDVTQKISSGKSRKAVKQLNEKSDGTHFLHLIPVREREVFYIPSDAVNDSVLENLNTGDYIGIYSEMEGLDASHAGIVIREQDTVKLRHASSSQKNRKVVDDDFRDYLRVKPGIIVLRPIN